MNTKFLTTGEAAVRLGVSLRTVQLWTASGTLTASRTPGGHRRIREQDVDELLRSMRNVSVTVEKNGDGESIEHTSQSLFLLAGRIQDALDKGSLDRKDPQKYVALGVLALRQYARHLLSSEVAAAEVQGEQS